MATVDLFADLGIEAAHEGALPEAMALFAARLDLEGHGALLTALSGTCWAVVHGGGVAGCRCKGTPDPRPVPPPPPPTPPPVK